jgi:hypothetical protein
MNNDIITQVRQNDAEYYPLMLTAEELHLLQFALSGVKNDVLSKSGITVKAQLHAKLRGNRIWTRH